MEHELQRLNGRLIGDRVEPAFEAARLVALGGVGTVALAIWIGVVLTVPPQRLLTYLAFFLSFWIFAGSYAACALYWISAHAEFPHPRALANSVREGGLLAAILSVNLALMAGHKWTILGFAVTVGLGLACELAGRLRTPAARDA